MNSNWPLFKIVQKVSKHFDSKPIFVDYDFKKCKVHLRPYNKKKRDIPNLIQINGVPFCTALELYHQKCSKYRKYVFNLKNIYFIVASHGEPVVNIITDTRFVKQVKYETNKEGLTTIYCHPSILDDMLDLVQEKYPRLFKI